MTTTRTVPVPTAEELESAAAEARRQLAEVEEAAAQARAAADQRAEEAGQIWDRRFLDSIDDAELEADIAAARTAMVAAIANDPCWQAVRDHYLAISRRSRLAVIADSAAARVSGDNPIVAASPPTIPSFDELARIVAAEGDRAAGAEADAIEAARLAATTTAAKGTT